MNAFSSNKIDISRFFPPGDQRNQTTNRSSGQGTTKAGFWDEMILPKFRGKKAEGQKRLKTIKILQNGASDSWFFHPFFFISFLRMPVSRVSDFPPNCDTRKTRKVLGPGCEKCNVIEAEPFGPTSPIRNISSWPFEWSLQCLHLEWNRYTFR